MGLNLDEEFYRNSRREFENYVRDYSEAVKRSSYFEEQSQERITQAEQDYKILEKFGAII